MVSATPILITDRFYNKFKQSTNSNNQLKSIYHEKIKSIISCKYVHYFNDERSK